MPRAVNFAGLTQPHQEHCTPISVINAGVRRYQPGYSKQSITCLQTAERADRGLPSGQCHSSPNGYSLVGSCRPCCSPCFLQLLSDRHHERQELHNDRGRNIGHNPQRKCHTTQRAAGEHRPPMPRYAARAFLNSRNSCSRQCWHRD